MYFFNFENENSQKPAVGLKKKIVIKRIGIKLLVIH